MQFIFIWMEKYRNYIKQGFNFGGPLRFKYDEEFNRLIVQSAPFFIKDFFHPSVGNDTVESKNSSITNVTAIIGENGTGKSNLLEYLRELVSLDVNEQKLSHIVIFQNDQNEFVVYHTSDMKFEIINPLKVRIHKKDYTEINPSSLPLGIYFTNIFDSRKAPPTDYRFYDISTNRLLNDYFSSAEQASLNGFHMAETEQQIRFIKSRKSKNADKIPFKLPDKIKIFIIQPENIWAVDKENRFNSDFENYIRNMQQELLSYYQDCKITLNFKYHIAIRVLDHLSVETQNINIRKDLKDIDKVLDNINIKYDLSKNPNNKKLEGHDLLNAKISIFIKNLIKHSKNTRTKSVLESSYRVLKLISSLPEILPEEDFFELPMMDENDTLEQLIHNYHISVHFDNYLQFQWPGLSSGEISLLNLYTRFFRLRNVASKTNKKHILVLIDEGEALFHPQWQKELVFKLINYLSDIFENKKIQLVLTSNSPFIASDLPKTNVIFLKKDAGKTISIQELDDQHQTFAANIHTLLADSFFLHDGLMGTFARQKINEVIDLLVNKAREEVMVRKGEIESLISIIGEPIIRTKLTHLLQEKVLLQNLSLEERVSILEAKLLQQEGDRDYDTN